MYYWDPYMEVGGRWFSFTFPFHLGDFWIPAVSFQGRRAKALRVILNGNWNITGLINGYISGKKSRPFSVELFHHALQKTLVFGAHFVGEPSTPSFDTRSRQLLEQHAQGDGRFSAPPPVFGGTIMNLINRLWGNCAIYVWMVWRVVCWKGEECILF